MNLNEWLRMKSVLRAWAPKWTTNVQVNSRKICGDVSKKMFFIACVFNLQLNGIYVIHIHAPQNIKTECCPVYCTLHSVFFCSYVRNMRFYAACCFFGYSEYLAINFFNWNEPQVTQWSAVITQFENGVAIGSYGFFLVGFSLAQSPTIGPCWTGMGNFTAVIGIAVNKTTMQRIIFPMWCVSYGLSTASHHTKY